PHTVANRKNEKYSQSEACKTPGQRDQDRLAEHQAQDAAAGEAERLEHPDLARALPHAHHQSVADDHQDRHERRAYHQFHDERDIAELRDERLTERLLRVGRCLVGGVGEHLVDRPRYAIIQRWRGGPQRQPADLVLAERAGLVEIIVLKYHKIGVHLRLLACEDPDNGEIPAARAVLLREDAARDRYVIADLPSPLLRHCVADKRACTLADEGLPCR